VGAASVDLRARVVERGSETQELTAREFALLDFLLKHRGEVVGRGRILDRVWEMSHNPTTNVVDVYIRRLREMLDPPDLEGTDGSIIETVRGEGYRLRPQEEWGAEDE
jgi:two-component system OmpR family response regulator